MACIFGEDCPKEIDLSILWGLRTSVRECRTWSMTQTIVTTSQVARVIVSKIYFTSL